MWFLVGTPNIHGPTIVSGWCSKSYSLYYPSNVLEFSELRSEDHIFMTNWPTCGQSWSGVPKPFWQTTPCLDHPLFAFLNMFFPPLLGCFKELAEVDEWRTPTPVQRVRIAKKTNLACTHFIYMWLAWMWLSKVPHTESVFIVRVTFVWTISFICKRNEYNIFIQ